MNGTLGQLSVNKESSKVIRQKEVCENLIEYCRFHNSTKIWDHLGNHGIDTAFESIYDAI